MGSSKGSSSPQYTSQDAYNYGYGLKTDSVRMEGLDGLDPNMEGYSSIYDGYMQAHNEKVQGELFKNMMADQAQGQEDYYAALNAQNAQNAQAQEQARLAGLTNSRDAAIGGYFDAANTATSFVNDKMDTERANAALMGVDYNATDEAKNDRIANYFSTLWSEGDQQALEGSFAEVGAGGFEQSIWRGEGTESSTTPGSVGAEQTGGGITPVKNKLMEEDTLSTNTALGA